MTKDGLKQTLGRVPKFWWFIAAAVAFPLLDNGVAQTMAHVAHWLSFEGFDASDLIIVDEMRTIFIFAILGVGLNVLVGYTGLLNLGVAGFVAIGAYSYSILTCEIYPFQLNFWWGSLATLLIGACAGLLLGLPTLRLHGDYLAIVTLGFGEIIQDSLRNLEGITKGTQGINPIPAPSFFGHPFTSDQHLSWYYLLLVALALVVVVSHNLQRSRIGRAWISIREDELAAACMGISPVKTKLLAFAMGSALCSLAGALYASNLGSSAEPGAYDFQMSVVVLCIVIVGGMGNLSGVLVGALVMIGLNSIVLVKLSAFLSHEGIMKSENIFSQPNNWKYLILGLTLILMMRFRPEGLLPSRRVKAELHAGDAPKVKPT